MAETTDDKQLRMAVESIASGNPEALTAADVEALLERYPYFTLPAAELLKAKGAQLDADTKKALTDRVALSTTNPTDLYMLLEPGNERHARFYPDSSPKRPTTENAIERFFDNFATTSPEEEELLNRLIFNPAPDYAQILAAEDAADIPIVESAEPGSDDDRINRFILANREEIKPIAPEVAANEPSAAPATEESGETGEPSENKGANDSLLSESLARIFIRQRQYERAFEIIEQLNLNFPEKSVYFADQLRFLRKLINYEKLKNRK